MIWHVLNSDTIWLEHSLGSQLLKLASVVLGEAPLLGYVDLLAARELEFATPDGLDGMGFVSFLGADRQDGLTNVYTGHKTLRFTKRTTHSGLEPISSSTRQHFVDADDMEWVEPYSHVERVLAAVLHHVFVGTDTSGL